MRVDEWFAAATFKLLLCGFRHLFVMTQALQRGAPASVEMMVGLMYVTAVVARLIGFTVQPKK